MGLKFEIDSLEGVDEAVKGLYTEVDGKFRLGVEGLPRPEDTSGLKKKLDELLNEKKSEAQKRKEAEAEAERIRLEAATKSGDVESLRKSYEDKIAGITTESQKKYEEAMAQIQGLTAGQDALKLASKLALTVKGTDGKSYSTADVLLPHIQKRLGTEMVDGVSKTVVLDKDGKPSAQTLDDLFSEFDSNPAFAGVVSGTKANGAGHRSNLNGGGAAKKFNEMNGAELKDLREKNPTEYDRLKNEFYGT